VVSLTSTPVMNKMKTFRSFSPYEKLRRDFRVSRARTSNYHYRCFTVPIRRTLLFPVCWAGTVGSRTPRTKRMIENPRPFPPPQRCSGHPWSDLPKYPRNVRPLLAIIVPPQQHRSTSVIISSVPDAFSTDCWFINAFVKSATTRDGCWSVALYVPVHRLS